MLCVFCGTYASTVKHGYSTHNICLSIVCGNVSVIPPWIAGRCTAPARSHVHTASCFFSAETVLRNARLVSTELAMLRALESYNARDYENELIYRAAREALLPGCCMRCEYGPSAYGHLSLARHTCDRSECPACNHFAEVCPRPADHLADCPAATGAQFIQE